MAADDDRAVIYDRDWHTVGEFTVSVTDNARAAVRSGPTDGLKPGERYMASIYGRYYACTPETSAGGLVLQLNAWSKGMSTGAV